MATKVIMPQGGQDLLTGKVVRWIKKEGDPVMKGEAICEVETEKAVFEVEAPCNGVLQKIVVPEGMETEILATIGLVGEPGEAPQTTKVTGVAESLPSAPFVSQPALDEEAIATPTAPLGAPTKRIKISPKAKRIAEDQGVPIHLLDGTGPQGRITEKDVWGYLESQKDLSGEVEGSRAPGGRVMPISKVRQVVARRMQLSKQAVPHFYVTVVVDMTEALRFREDFNGHLSESAEKLSVTDLITRACALALCRYPELNSSVQDESHFTVWEDINIGIAAATDQGLVVPILEKADRLSLSQIALQTRRIVDLAKEGKQANLTPGTFTISNLGMFNVTNFIAIINPPEAAILAVSSLEKQLVPVDPVTICLRDRLNITLSVDHRLGDGLLAARFLNQVKSFLEDPSSLE